MGRSGGKVHVRQAPLRTVRIAQAVTSRLQSALNCDSACRDLANCDGPRASALLACQTVAVDADWLNDVAHVVLDTTVSSRFVSRTAAQLARGLSPQTAMSRLLDTPAARAAVAQQDVQLLFGPVSDGSPRSRAVSTAILERSARADARASSLRASVLHPVWDQRHRLSSCVCPRPLEGHDLPPNSHRCP